MPRYRENFYNEPAEMNEEEEESNYNATNESNNEVVEGEEELAGEGEAQYEAAVKGENPSPSPAEGFGNLNMNTFPVDLVLKSIFFGAIFYLLSLPEVYKMTKKCCKSVDGVLLHSVVFAILYFILIQFIN